MQFWSHDTKISRTTKFHCGNTRERHETLKHIAQDIVSCKLFVKFLYHETKIA
jgi:hypothetical protein